MANINKLSWSFVDNQTTIYAEHMNGIVGAINSIIDALDKNSGNGSQSQEPMPTPETVATPSISISGTTATISCSTGSATIYYTLNGNTPTTSSTQYSGPITLSGACTIKAIAAKSGMTTSQVGQATYTPSSQRSQQAQAVISKFANMSSANQDKVATFIDSLVSAGIYSKINYLMLPCVASSVSEAVQNVLSDTTPQAISNATIANGGLQFTAPTCVQLHDMMVGTPDYANYAVSFAGAMDTQQTGTQRRILTFGSTPEQGTSPSGKGQSIAQLTKDSTISYVGYGAGRSLNSRYTVCHDDTAKKEFYVTSGDVTSADDTTTINVSDGIYLGSWIDDIESTTYRSLWHGTYRLFIFTNLLTESELLALENAIGTFVA